MAEQYDRKNALLAAVEAARQAQGQKAPEQGLGLVTPEVTPQPPLVEPQVATIENLVEPPPFVIEPEPPPVVEKPSLNELRKKYVKAKHDLDNFGPLKSFWDNIRHKGTKEKIQAEYEKAKTDYERTRAEYIASNAEDWDNTFNKFLQEKDRLVEERINHGLENRGGLNKAYGLYKQLGEWNLLRLYEKSSGKTVESKVAKGVLRAINVKNAISASLLGVGVVSGFSSVVGFSAIGARRAFGGLGGGIGSYDLTNFASLKLNERSIKKDLEKAIGRGDLEKHLASYEARAILQGKKLEDLSKDDLYKQLKDKYEGLVKSDVELNSEEGLIGKLNSELVKADGTLVEQIKEKKSQQRYVKAFSGLIGLTMGGKHLFGAISDYWHNHSVPTSPVDSAGVKLPASTGLKVEAPAMTSVSETAMEIKAGARGIEGALLDLKKTDPAKYHKMLEWMNAQKGGGLSTTDVEKDAGRIVHRFVNQFALDKGYTIGDGGTKDLNRMFSAGMKLNSDGSIMFEEQGFKFMQPVETEDLKASMVVTEQAEPINLAEIENKARAVAEQVLAEQGYKGTTEVSSVVDSSESPASSESVLESVLDEGGNKVEGASTAQPSSSTVEKVSTSAIEVKSNAGSVEAPQVSKEPVLSDLEQAQKDYEQAKIDIEDTYSKEEALNISKALETKDLTQSLKLVYGSEYGKLFKLGKFKPSELKKIQDWNLDEVLSKCATDKKFEKKFRLVHDIIDTFKDNTNLDLGSSLKTFLVKYSPQIKGVMERFKPNGK